MLTGDSFFSLTSEKRRRLGLDMCGAAKMTCCLAPDGNVYPCAFLQEAQFMAGNMSETQSLDEIWHTSPIFNNISENWRWHPAIPVTGSIPVRGGCPAVAYHMFHDISQPDPECLMDVPLKLTDVLTTNQMRCVIIF